MKTLCALIGAFFLVAGLAVLVADLAKGAPRAGAGSSVSASPATALRPHIREAASVRPRHAAPAAAEVVSQRR